MTRRFLSTGGILLAVLALALLIGRTDTAYATFNPVARFCFDDFTTVDENPTLPGDPGECDGDNSAGAAATFAIGADIESGDVIFAATVSYIPPEWEITHGDEFPLGTLVGLEEAVATIGIINGACDNALNLTTSTGGFPLFNGSIDIKDTIDFEAEDEGDPLRQDWVEDLDENGLFDAVDKYPEFINRVITDEDDNPQQPISRSVGTLVIAGADVLLQFLTYDPGTFINKNLANDPALGYPSVVLLQNFGDPEIVPEPGPITDFCTPLRALTTNFGTGDACDSVVDDDEDDLINDGCPILGSPETASECVAGNSNDEDEDGVVNDGCPEQDSAESGAECDNNQDDDGDFFINDGCPAVGDPETDAVDECANNLDDDRNNDLDFSRAAGQGEIARVNDGCPADGDSEADIEYILWRNPAEEGNYTLTTILVGQPDADGDGIENLLDTCPFDPNVGDPRIKGDGDLDDDGLDAACDPDDGNTNSDEDADGYLNRQDNCPLIPNGEETGNQEDEDVDEDGDRQIDFIGDACDPNPLVYDGEPLAERTRTLTVDIEIGPPGEDTPTDDGDGDGGGGGGDDDGGSATLIIVIAIIAGVAVLGGGAFYFMRRGGAGGATT